MIRNAGRNATEFNRRSAAGSRDGAAASDRRGSHRNPRQLLRDPLQEGGGAGPLTAWQAFVTAAANVGESWSKSTSPAGIESIRAQVECICRHVRDAVAEETPVRLSSRNAMPALQLLEAIRRAFLERLRHSGERIDPHEALRVLHAFEAVRGASERCVAQRLVQHLSGPDASDLIVKIAHDMRSPLTSIIFLVDMMRAGRSGPVTDVQERQLGIAYSAAFGLSSLANDLLEAAHGGRRLVDDEPTAFSMAELVASVHDIVRPVAEEKGLRLLVSSSVPGFRCGHPAALSRVLLNLTTNALKYTVTGEVVLSVRMKSRRTIAFAVADTGRGIPPAVMDVLFEPVRHGQEHGESTFSSAGLGLSICRQLVEIMGGELQIETEQEKGTRLHFQLDLPAADRI
ncbi:MAG: sensor histidine kinase [Gemmatimonadaceae bacterium]